MKDLLISQDKDYQLNKWGIVWLKAIDDLYLKNGLDSVKLSSDNISAIKNLKINHNIVTAEVKGSDFRLYGIEVTFSSVNDNIKEQIKKIISSIPSISLNMAFGYLSETFIKNILNNSISIFPYSLENIKINCTCKQGLDCKHVMPVYGYIEKEINKNPILLFNLAGINTSELLDASCLKEILDKKLQKSIHKKFISIEENKEQFETKDIENIKTFEFTNSDMIPVFDLMPPNPVFFERKDFKSKLVSIYETVEEDLNSILVKEELPPLRNTEVYLYYEDNNSLNAFISPANSFLYYLKSKGSRSKYYNERLFVPVRDENEQKYIIKPKEGIVTSIENVFDFFLYSALNEDDTIIGVSSKFLKQTAILALALVKSLSFIPEVVMHDQTNFIIRYIPLEDKTEIIESLEYLKSIMPLNIISKDNGNKILSKDVYHDILSMFITHIIHKLAFLKTSKIKKSDVSNIFTKPQLINAILPDGKNAAISISNWLNILSSRNKPFKPLIRIESSENSDNKQIFSVYIDILDNKNNCVIKLSDLLQDKENNIYAEQKQHLADIISQLSTLSDYFYPAKLILDSNGLFVPEIALREVLDLFTNSLNILNLLGIELLIPNELKRVFTPRILLKAKVKKSDFDIDSIFNANENVSSTVNKLFDFSYEIAIGDQSISKEEFLELVKEAEGIIKYKDQYISLKPEDINSILDKLNKPMPEFSSPLEFLHSTMSGFINDLDFDSDEAIKKAIRDFIKIEDIILPADLKGTLRPYQERGYRWLYSNSIRGFGSCIADDMGLGKTIQVISMILKFKEEKKLEKPVLVICPTTLVGNWQKECAKFAPSLKVNIYHGLDRKLKLNNTDIIITTYGLLRSDIDAFKDTNWDLVIIDEAQNIKNPDTAQTIAVKSIKTKMAIAMTGTPVENKLSELWSIFDFTNRGYLGSISEFQRNYAGPIEKNRNFERIDKLRLVTQPFVLRRLKSDKSIINDLPEKIIFDEYCYLTKEQAALYEKVLETSFKNIENKSGIHRKGHIFKLITSLKQICNHPVQYTKLEKPLKSLSGKTEKAFSIIEQIMDQNEKLVVFTQYKEMGDLLVEMIKDEFNKNVPFFHGSVPRAKRDIMVEEFQANKDINLMIISLKAGGTGLNLTAATNVLHYDLWWNPAVEDQATDRTYRIGQTKNVIVHRLITLGTFEEKIDEMIKSKKELADLTVLSGEKMLTELSDRELKEIFSLSRF